MIKKFQGWFRLPFRSLRDQSVAASGVLMIKNKIVYYDSSTMWNYFSFTIRSIIVMKKNQSKQVTGCSNLVVVLDLHEIALAIII